MFKHRFIIRDVSDVRIFAAIPVESSLLTWKRWVRPPDWEALTELLARVRATIATQGELWKTVASRYDDMAMAREKFARDDGEMSASDVYAFNKEARAYRDRASHASGRAEAFLRARADELLARLQRLLVERPAEMLVLPDAIKLFEEVCTDLIEDVRFVHDGQLAWLDLEVAEVDEMVQVNEARVARTLRARETRHVGRAEIMKFARLSMQQTIKEAYDEIRKVKWWALANAAQAMISSDPLPTTSCPPGLPFAAYTVEFDGTAVSVVEGCAWVSARPRPPQEVIDCVAASIGDEALDKLAAGVIEDKTNQVVDEVTEHAFVPTDDERRVVEIVSQMLCERSLNPKADTRIPVREIDPAKAHQTREAERRDTAKGSATIRTIKFEVTPPRYLREAAEHILTNPRKAHWVIGHWRNQPYGEKRTLRKQLWIAPHIRGLGEASGTTTRVVAPRPEHPTT